jgi:hypothetical protein
MRRSVLRYSVEWQEDAPNVAPEERATVADVRLCLNDQNISLHIHGKHSIDHLTISLYPVAEGLVHDWWSLFGARDREFSLIKYRGGYAVPDMRLKFDGAIFEVSAHERTYRNPEVRFLVGPTEVMTRAQGEDTVAHFIECVLERLVSKGVNETNAAMRWARIQESRADPEEAKFCEAAGALSLDPYKIDDQHAAFIEKAASIFEGEPLTEFLAGASGADLGQLLRWVEEVDRPRRHTARVAELGAAAQQAEQIAPSRSSEQSWSLGYRRARAMRRAMGLTAADRFRSFKQLADKLGASTSFSLAKHVDGIRALRSDHNDGVYVHMRSHGTSQGASSHLFSFARAVGDAACFPLPAKAPVNELHSAYRQAAGRAFAAEFLAPINEILSMRADGRDTVSIAEEFSVAITVIERQIENTKRIHEACA